MYMGPAVIKFSKKVAHLLCHLAYLLFASVWSALVAVEKMLELVAVVVDTRTAYLLVFPAHTLSLSERAERAELHRRAEERRRSEP